MLQQGFRCFLDEIMWRCGEALSVLAGTTIAFRG